MGLMFNAGLAVRSKEVQARLATILEFKLQHMDYGTYGWWGILLSGKFQFNVSFLKFISG